MYVTVNIIYPPLSPPNVAELAWSKLCSNNTVVVSLVTIAETNNALSAMSYWYNLTAPIYEDKVVDFVLEKVTLKDKKVSRKDLFGAEVTQEKPKETKPKTKKGKTAKKKA